jgi:hypothetical protein
MIKLRHQQPSLWHRGLAEDIAELWEPWMRLVDELLEDEHLLDTVYKAQGERHPQSRRRGRMPTPAEVLLRLLLLKHIRNWSYAVLEREVRANLVYRAFTRIGDEKVPDAKTLARLGQFIGPKVIEQLHQRVVELAQERGVTRGRKLRVDTTVVETNIHYPTDSSLLGDGTRVLTRTRKKIEAKSGGLKRKVRDRMRSVHKRVVAIALSTRLLGPPGEERRKRQYRELLSLTRKVRESGAKSIARSEPGTAPPSRFLTRSGGIAGDHGREGSASGATDEAEDLRRSYPIAGKDRKRVRAAHGNHSQGEGEQADRVWQAGQDPGSGKSDCDPLPGVCGTTSGFNSVAVLDPGAPTEIGASTKLGGCRCGILFPRTGASCAKDGRAEDLGTQQEYQERGTETSSSPALVSERAKVEDRL